MDAIPDKQDHCQLSTKRYALGYSVHASRWIVGVAPCAMLCATTPLLFHAAEVCTCYRMEYARRKKAALVWVLVREKLQSGQTAFLRTQANAACTL